MNKENLINLKLDMQKLEIAKEELKTKQEQFNLDNKNFFDVIEELQNDIKEYRTTITTEALDEFKVDGNKKRLGGVGIRVTKLINYKEETAIHWAKDNMPICVKQTLDKKTFENFAKSNTLDIVEYSEKTSVTFPKEIILED